MKYIKYSTFCVSEIIYLAKKKQQNTNQEKLFNKDITNVTKKNQNQLILGWPEENSSVQSRL